MSRANSRASATAKKTPSVAQGGDTSPAEPGEGAVAQVVPGAAADLAPGNDRSPAAGEEPKNDVIADSRINAHESDGSSGYAAPTLTLTPGASTDATDEVDGAVADEANTAAAADVPAQVENVDTAEAIADLERQIATLEQSDKLVEDLGEAVNAERASFNAASELHARTISALSMKLREAVNQRQSDRVEAAKLREVLADLKSDADEAVAEAAVSDDA